MTKDVYMKKSEWWYIQVCISVLIGLAALPGWGQDQVPTSPRADIRIQMARELKLYRLMPDTVGVRVLFPEAFLYIKSNRIEDRDSTLKPIMERLYRLRLGEQDDTLRIAHIGDSHVRGRVYPHTIRTKLIGAFRAISYTDMGVNGATCLTFTHPDRIEAIAELQPELLILSFGTNESHNKRYNSIVHYYQVDELVRLIRTRIPGITILLTTPPGSYESFRQNRRRRTYSINPRTATAVNTIRKYAHDRKLAVWDMYNVVGGKEYACKNWWNAGLMRSDHVHYTPEGYVLQGELFFEALINTYNEYVID